MHRSAALVASLVLIAAACSGTPAPPTLAEELAADAGTITNSVATLQDALARRYDTLAQLYSQITDMRLTETVAIALDKASRVDTDEQTQVVLDIYLDYGDNVLNALSDLDAAIATQDVGAADVAAASIDAASGSVALDLGPDMCAIAVPPSSQDLCDRPHPVDQYETDLQRIILHFVAAYRPLLRLPEAFGDVVRGSVLTRLAPQVVDLLDGVTSQLGELTPDQPHTAMQQALVDLVANTRARWAAVDPEQVDLLIGQILTGDLGDITCASADSVAAARALLLAAVPDSVIPAAIALLIDDPDAGCVDR